MADNQQRQVKLAHHSSVTSERERERVKAKFLGNIHGLHLHDGYAGAVFSIYGTSPVLTTCAGGGREPHVLIMRKL